MIFNNNLTPGTLLKRYKRFLADIRLEDGSIITAYCPNTGSMKGCAEPGSKVFLSLSDNPKRKYVHTLEMVHSGECWVGVNTSLTNEIVAEAIADNRVAELQNIESIRREVKISQKTRLDLLLEKDGQKIYVEIKNCSLVEDGVAMFPDAVTARGTKHLLELADLVREGHGGVIFYLVQRTDGNSFRAASHIDPLYAETLSRVTEEGVQVLVYQAVVGERGINVERSLPWTP